jgi:hypothetical protein
MPVRDRVINMKRPTKRQKKAKQLKRGHIQSLKVEFRWSGRPWYVGKGKKFRVVTEGGIPRDVADLPKLYEGFRVAFAAIGAKLEENDPTFKWIACKRCGTGFEPMRTTARFCETCRVSHDRRKEEDPRYERENRKRAQAGMKLLRDSRRRKGGQFISQNRKGRKTKSEMKEDALKKAEALSSLLS